MNYNPFSPNFIISSNLFAGREEYVLKVIRKLDRLRWVCHQVFLYCERGIGKTALAKLIQSVAKSNDNILGNLDFSVSG